MARRYWLHVMARRYWLHVMTFRHWRIQYRSLKVTSDDRVWWEQVYSVAQRVRGRGGGRCIYYHSPTIIRLNPRNVTALPLLD